MGTRVHAGIGSAWGGAGRMGGVSVWACGSSLCDVGFEPPENGAIHLSIYSSSISSSSEVPGRELAEKCPRKAGVLLSQPNL